MMMDMMMEKPTVLTLMGGKVINMKKYVVGYIEYQHCELGDDSYDGWQSTYSVSVFDNKISAVNLVNKLKKDRFYKNIFIAEEIEV